MNSRVGLCLTALFMSAALVSPLMAFQQNTTGNWYKGNLHTHSFWSDGNDFPEMIVKWYAEHDYQFLALTDHNILSRGQRWINRATVVKRGGETAIEKYLAAFGSDWVETREKSGKEQFRLKGLAEFRDRFEETESFLLMTGEEISDSVNGFPVHMNATNLESVILPMGGKTVREAMQNNLRAAADQAESEDREILVHLNHPEFWLGCNRRGPGRGRHGEVCRSLQWTPKCESFGYRRSALCRKDLGYCEHDSNRSTLRPRPCLGLAQTIAMNTTRQRAVDLGEVG